MNDLGWCHRFFTSVPADNWERPLPGERCGPACRLSPFATLRRRFALPQSGDELRVVADHGSPSPSADLAEAILRIPPRLCSVHWGTYHFAGTGETTWHGFASRIVEAQAVFTGRRPKVNAITTADFPTKARRPQNSVLDSSRFAAVFGFKAEPWEQAVGRTVAELLVGFQR